MLTFLAERVITPLLQLFLISSGGILLVTLRFFPFCKTSRILGTLFDKNAAGDSWRALSVALAGTLGVGNIIGIAYALKEGGAGALFWMWVSSLFAMILKYSETVLAILHRKTLPCKNTESSLTVRAVGGAMYYIPHKVPAVFFAILCIASSFTVGNLVQVHAVSDALTQCFSLPTYAVGILFALFTLFIISRGITRITRFCAAVIPFFSAVYLLMCGTVLLKNASLIPSLLQRIFSEAFSLKAFGSGSVGSVLYHAMRVGFSKGLITNEAGCGTAPIAHASAVSTDAVKQGFLGIVEVFFDTVILCTASGLVLLTAIDKYPTQNGFALVTAAFSGVFGKLGEILLALSIFFFVIATLVGWSYYGKTALEFLTPNKKIGTAYLILFSLTAIWGVIGAENRFWALSDITLGLMTFINTGYLVFFRNDIRKATDKFFLYTKRSALGQKPKADRKS